MAAVPLSFFTQGVLIFAPGRTFPRTLLSGLTADDPGSLSGCECGTLSDQRDMEFSDIFYHYRNPFVKVFPKYFHKIPWEFLKKLLHY